MRAFKRLKATLILCAVFACVAGCAGSDSGSQAITDESKVAQIQKGISTKNNITSLFGQPSGKNFSDNGDEVWTYTFNSTHLDPKSYIPIIGAVIGGASAKASSLTVTFDKNGTVKSYGVTNQDVTTGHGVM